MEMPRIRPLPQTRIYPRNAKRTKHLERTFFTKFDFETEFHHCSSVILSLKNVIRNSFDMISMLKNSCHPPDRLRLTMLVSGNGSATLLPIKRNFVFYESVKKFVRNVTKSIIISTRFCLRNRHLSTQMEARDRHEVFPKS